jgi:hypothetical protein
MSDRDRLREKMFGRLWQVYTEMRVHLSRIGIRHETVRYDYPGDTIPGLSERILSSNARMRQWCEMVGDPRSYDECEDAVKGGEFEPPKPLPEEHKAWLERQALDAALDEFMADCRARLHEMAEADRGKRGCAMEHDVQLANDMLTDARDVFLYNAHPQKLIDIANRAMMLWWRRKNRKGGG